MNVCPHCGADLRGKEIPAEYQKPMYGGQTHYSRIIGVQVRGVYDGVLFWKCPDCAHGWHRWPEGHRLHQIAERYMIQ